jgi:hypothetical protein
VKDDVFTLYERIMSYEEHQREWENLKKSSNWGLLQTSVKESKEIPFWIQYLDQNKFYTETLFERIKSITGVSGDLDIVYANGQTYGLCGDLHKDGYSKGVGKTFILYMNPTWNVTWGGSTVFYKDGNVYTSEYKPNCGILFDGSIDHAGLEPTRHCEEMRITVAFKIS